MNLWARTGFSPLVRFTIRSLATGPFLLAGNQYPSVSTDVPLGRYSNDEAMSPDQAW